MDGLKDALQYVAEELVPARVSTIDGRQYTDKTVHPVKKPMPETLTVHTLTGLVEYLLTGGDLEETAGIIHVVAPEGVRVYSKLLEPFEQRAAYLTANLFDGSGFRFNEFMEHEQFVIRLQSLFVQDETAATILRLIGNIKDSNVATLSDDGVSQTVKTRAGVALVEDARIPNPVALRPYRTFREIEQPASQFILRLRSGRGDLPEAALFEADGGTWRLAAIQGIKTFLVEKLPGWTIIA